MIVATGWLDSPLTPRTIIAATCIWLILVAVIAIGISAIRHANPPDNK